MQAVKKPHSMSTGAYMEPIPNNLLLEPIEYIFADHYRQADMCAALEELADRVGSMPPDQQTAPPDQQTAQAILISLDRELSLHIADEEVDLFPRLSARALPEDHFPELEHLSKKEHERDSALVDEVRVGLGRLAQGKPLKKPESFRRAASSLAKTRLSHLDWENTVLLPLARRRLTDEDLKDMSRTMTARQSAAHLND